MSSNNQNPILNNITQLSIHRDKMKRIEKDNEFLNAATQETEIVATMYYYNFIVLLVIALFLVILLIKFSLTVNGQRGGGNSDRNYNGYLFLLSIMILFLLMPYFKYSF